MQPSSMLHKRIRSHLCAVFRRHPLAHLQYQSSTSHLQHVLHQESPFLSPEWYELPFQVAEPAASAVRGCIDTTTAQRSENEVLQRSETGGKLNDHDICRIITGAPPNPPDADAACTPTGLTSPPCSLRPSRATASGSATASALSAWIPPADAATTASSAGCAAPCGTGVPMSVPCRPIGTAPAPPPRLSLCSCGPSLSCTRDAPVTVPSSRISPVRVPWRVTISSSAMALPPLVAAPPPTGASEGSSVFPSACP